MNNSKDSLFLSLNIMYLLYSEVGICLFMSTRIYHSVSCVQVRSNQLGTGQSEEMTDGGVRDVPLKTRMSLRDLVLGAAVI